MQKKDYIIQLLKYIIMAIVVGIIVGAIDALFGRVLIAIFTAIPANCWAGDHSNVLRIQ